MTEFLTLAERYSFYTCVVALFISCVLRDNKWRLFNLITCLSFAIAYVLDDSVKSQDPDKTWRYVFWVLNDSVWYGLIYVFWQRGKIYDHQAVIAGLVALALILLNGLRFIDRHFFELAFTTSFYKPFYPAITLLVVLLCWLPVISLRRSR